MNDSHPWLRFYGKIPTTLVYPEVTLYEALSQVSERLPDTVAWDFFDTRATYRRFLEDIDRCANFLSALGLKAGERMLIAMPNSPQGIIAFYAANKLGAVPALVHPLSTGPELEYFLNATGARIALTLDLFYGNFSSARSKVPLETLIVARITEYLPLLKSFAFWLARGRKTRPVPADARVRWWGKLMSERHPAVAPAARTADDPAAILFSGGVTGTPKGIVLSNRNFIAEGTGAAAWGGMQDVQSILAIMPMFHGFGLGVCINAAFMNGGTAILVPSFSPQIVADLMRRKRPNIIVGVPTLYAALMRHPALAKADLSCLRAAFCGADMLPRPVKESFEQFVAQRGGRVKLLEGYGLTEAVTAVMAMPPTEYREGSIGIPFPGMDAKICQIETQDELPPGEQGEICVNGPAVMLGYLDDPAATSQALRVHADGRVWLHTGDLGAMDADGFFYFKGRYKRLIKSSGYSVFPAQVEDVLYAHPLVRQVCVAGVPDPLQVERVVAFVVLKDQALAGTETEQLLIDHCQAQLVKWSCPREVDFCQELPQTRLGKIDYKALVKQHIERSGDSVPAEQFRHGGDRIASALKAHGVRFLFTLCGGHISPILTGAKAHGIRVIDIRDEATAVFAADAVARITGHPGVAAVTAGPGLTNTLTALKNAQLAQSPVILLGGAAATALAGRGSLQDIDQLAVVAPHVKLAYKVRRVCDLVPAIEEAFRVAREGVPGPVLVECPVDLLYDEQSVKKSYAEGTGKGSSFSERFLRWYLKRHVDLIFAGTGEEKPRVHHVATPAASDYSVERAATALAGARRPLMVIGSQALVLPVEASRVATAISGLAVPVYLSGVARGLLGREHNLQMHHQRRQALGESDCVLLAGVPCDFRLDYGRQIKQATTLITVNRSRKEARLNRRPDICAVGDAGEFLIRLSSRFSSSQVDWRDWVEQLRGRDAAREREIDERAAADGELVNPIALLREIDRAASDNAVFVADGGDFVATASYIVRPRGPLTWLDPGVFGTLGAGAGFALGAALCRPGVEVWLLYGDGAAGYSLVEFDTLVRHDIPVIAVVGNDAGWTQIAREQVNMLKDDVGTVLARTDYHVVAAGFGAEGIIVKSAGEVPAALARARGLARQGKPVLINVWLDRSDFRAGSISM